MYKIGGLEHQQMIQAPAGLRRGWRAPADTIDAFPMRVIIKCRRRPAADVPPPSRGHAPSRDRAVEQYVKRTKIPPRSHVSSRTRAGRLADTSRALPLKLEQSSRARDVRVEDAPGALRRSEARSNLQVGRIAARQGQNGEEERGVIPNEQGRPPEGVGEGEEARSRDRNAQGFALPGGEKEVEGG